MAGNRPGPEPKGDRKQITVRMPRTQHGIYKEAAGRLGMDLGDYLALQLARAHGLPEPAYINRAKQEPLPMAV